MGEAATAPGFFTMSNNNLKNANFEPRGLLQSSAQS
jgi:hypothetical protein